MRKSRTSSLKGKGLGKIPNAIPVSERPPEVADRAIPGHWEGDLIQGSKNSCIVTLVERHSRFVMLAKVRDKKTITVISALIKQARELPVELYKTLTWDRGAEMTSHTRDKYINGVSFESNYLTGVVPLTVSNESETNAFLSFCELLRLKGRVAQISFRKLPDRLFDSLREGSELPFSVSSVADERIISKFRPGHNFMWSEEERIPFLNPAFHITPEWEDYLKEVMSFG